MAKKKNKIVEENVKSESIKNTDDIKDMMPKKKAYKVLLVSSFLKQLKEDKLYFMCFLITLIAFFAFSANKVNNGDGIFPSAPNVTDKSSNKEEVNNLLDDKLNIKKYVGTYVKTYKLKKSIKYSDSCSIKEYDFVYMIDKDSSITKYFYTECLGSLLISKDTLSYVKTENTKNIGTKTDIFVFKDSKLTHMGGYTYKLNNDYVLDTENKNNDEFSLILYDGKFILHTLNNLYLISGKEVESQIINKNTLLDRSMFRVKDTSEFKYVVYEEDESQTCYIDSLINGPGFEDKNNYYIYSVKFDEETLSFSEPFIETARKRSDSCKTLEEDLAALKG